MKLVIKPGPWRKMEQMVALQQARQHGKFPARICDELDSTDMSGKRIFEYTPHGWWEWSMTMKQGGPVLFSGERGTGKTWAATFMAMAYYMNGYIINGHPRYWRLADLLAQQKATFGETRKPNTETPMEIAMAAGVLVLDEIDEIGGSEFDVSEVVRLIEARYDALQPTILISNRSPEYIATSLSPSIADRLKNGSIIEFDEVFSG